MIDNNASAANPQAASYTRAKNRHAEQNSRAKNPSPKNKGA